jgi:hypothetical protein
VVKESGLGGSRAGPEAPKPLQPAEGFVSLCHAPCVTLSEERLTAPHPLGSAGEPLSLGRSGRLSLAWALAGAEGRGETKDQVQTPVDREPEARASP